MNNATADLSGKTGSPVSADEKEALLADFRAKEQIAYQLEGEFYAAQKAARLAFTKYLYAAGRDVRLKFTWEQS